MKKFFATLMLMFLLQGTAYALTLDEAKQQGLVGEQLNGLLGLVKSDPAASKLIESVNKKRQSHYQQLADKNGISYSQVANRAGAVAIQKTSPGHFIQNNAGQWVKK